MADALPRLRAGLNIDLAVVNGENASRGGGIAPVAIGLIAERSSLGLAISMAGLVYVAAGILLVTAGLRFAPKDVARFERLIQTESKV